MYTCTDGDVGQQGGSSMFSLSGPGFFGAVGRSLNLGKLYFFSIWKFVKLLNLLPLVYMTGGQTALALRLLLALFSSKISSDINRPFGDEVL